METIKILSTKELHPSLVASVVKNGIFVDETPFISIHPILTEQKKKEIYKWISSAKNFFVFTSANAVDTIRRLHIPAFAHLAGRIIFTISGKTSKEAAKLFPDDRIVIADNAAALADMILMYKTKEIVFFCGDRRRDELPDLLAGHHIHVHEVIVYETREVPVQIETNYDAVLFFSPSGVNSFFSVNELQRGTKCFAIGNTTADMIRDYTDNEIIVADKPTPDSILEAVKKYFNKSIARNE
jgi:uroporphyrinogen-III synthase